MCTAVEKIEEYMTGLPPEQKEIPDFSLTVRQLSLTVRDDYSGHESTKLSMAQIIFKTKIALSRRKHLLE